MRKKKDNPVELVKDDLKWREWVTYKIGLHDGILKVLLVLSSVTLGLLVFILKLIL